MAKVTKAGIGNINYAGWYLQQRGIYAGIFYGSSLNYIHIKTNIPKQSSVMAMFEAIGYNLGQAYNPGKPVRCCWCFYTYSGTADPYSVGLTNSYTGLSAHGVYYSADNYTCLRAYHSVSTYYCGFSLDAYVNAGANPGYPVTVLAASQNNTAGNYY